MNRTSFRTPLVVGFALLLAAPFSANAQFGGLINKAKDKLAEKAGPVVPGEQLTEDLVGKLIAGLTAADRVLGDRDKATADRDAKNAELSVAVEKNGPVHSAYNSTNSKVNSCRSSTIGTLERTREDRWQKELTAKQADPDFISKMALISMKHARAMADAQQKNDAAAMTKARNDMQREILGVDLLAEARKDTAAADSKCGKAVALPAALAQEERLRKDVSALDDSIRQLEGQAVNEGAQAAGMERVRFTQLKERIFTILLQFDGKGGTGVKYAGAEVDAVKKHQSEIEKVRRAL